MGFHEKYGRKGIADTQPHDTYNSRTAAHSHQTGGKTAPGLPLVAIPAYAFYERVVIFLSPTALIAANAWWGYRNALALPGLVVYYQVWDRGGKRRAEAI